MKTNREILEVGYWSDSSSSSIRSEFDDVYYKMKPPPPQIYQDKIVVIQEGKFRQSETELPNTAKIPSHVLQEKPPSNHTNMAASSSKGESNINYPKAIKTDRDYYTVHPHKNITNGSNMQRISNGTSSAYNGTNINTAEQYQNVTVNKNFNRGTSYGGVLSKSNENNREPHQYPTSHSSITTNNSNKNYNLLSEPYQCPTSWNRVDEILSKRINQHPTHAISTNSQNTVAAKRSELIKQLPQSKTPGTIKMGRNQRDNASVTSHSTSINTIAPIGRHNLPSKETETASGNLNWRSLNRSKTYNTFSAVQPTARTNNAVQTRQPTSSNPMERNGTETIENTEDKCFQILCFCFTCR